MKRLFTTTKIFPEFDLIVAIFNEEFYKFIRN